MSRKSLLVLALVSLAACAEPPMGPSVNNNAGIVGPVPPRQHCSRPGNPDPDVTPLTAQVRQCVPLP
jgi:hypothetical protein